MENRAHTAGKVCPGRWLKIALSLLIVAAVLVAGTGCLVSSSAPTTVTTTPTPAATVSEVTALIYALANEERAKRGLPSLERDDFLEGLAMEHSENMAQSGYFGHERYGWERSLYYQLTVGTRRAENLARAPVREYNPGRLLSSEEIAAWTIQGWLDSPEHREALLDTGLTRTGVGIVKTDEYFYITQDFEGKSD